MCAVACVSEQPVVDFQHELAEVFINEVYKIPGGDKIKQCIQCGTCSGSCPTSSEMDYGPREVIAAFRAGMLDRVLRSNTVWLCTSCYYCTVRCPSGIKVTDIMYEAKRLGIEYGLVEEGAIAPTLSKAFVGMVDNYGRVNETMLIMKVLMKTKPWALLKMMPQGMKFITRGRLPLLAHKIKGVSELSKCADAMIGAESKNLRSEGKLVKEV